MRRKPRSSPKINIAQLKVLMRLSVLCAAGDRKGLRTLFSTRSFQRIPELKIEETLLEVHLFAGFPATIDAFIEFRKFTNRRIRTGVTRKDAWREKLGRGEKVCRRIYGNNYDKLVTRMKGLHPELAQWILEDGYGKVLSRSGLTLIERESVAIAALAAQGWKRQFESHVKGLENLGVRPLMLRRILLELGLRVSKPKVQALVTGTKFQ